MGFAPIAPYAVCSTKDCLMGSALGVEDGFCFQELDQQRMVLHPFVYSYDNLAASSSSSSSFFSCFGSLSVEIVQSLSCEFQKLREEMDAFFELENNRLRMSILEEETRQQAVIMQKYESRIKTLMLQKDQELALARNKTIELLHFLEGAEMEAKSWEKAAKEKEAIVSDLNNRLKQATERERLFPNDDAVSFCDSSSIGKGTGDRRSEQGSGEKMGCKMCQFRRSCLVFFPCRHLCCCKSCEPLLGHCPVCETVKESSLEALLA